MSANMPSVTGPGVWIASALLIDGVISELTLPAVSRFIEVRELDCQEPVSSASEGLGAYNFGRASLFAAWRWEPSQKRLSPRNAAPSEVDGFG